MIDLINRKRAVYLGVYHLRRALFLLFEEAEFSSLTFRLDIQHHLALGTPHTIQLLGIPILGIPIVDNFVCWK